MEIKPAALPKSVKQAIAVGYTLEMLTAAEAWQFQTVDGVITFVDDGTPEKLLKIYDPEGNEIKE
jgi:hypothetical protein